MNKIVTQIRKYAILSAVVFFISGMAYAATGTKSLSDFPDEVKGKIIDQNENPLYNVAVYTPGRTAEAFSGIDGLFTIESENDIDTLIFSKDGYMMQKLAVPASGGQWIITMVTEELSEKVAHRPWQTTPQKYSTASISSIQGHEINNVPVANLTNALAGRLTGIYTSQNAGEPGYDGAYVNIRGNRTFGNNSFVTFVDGYERDYGQFDPHEIESVSVLKDAVGNSQYGIFGGNGSIYVTTRRGKPFEKSINFSGQVGMQTPLQLPEFLGAYDYAVLYNEARMNDGLPVRYSDEALQAYQSGSQPYRYPNVNWQDELLRPSTLFQKYNFNIGGGNNIATYFISVGLLDQGGLYKYSDLNEGYETNAHFTRYNFRSNIDVNLDDRTQIRMDLAGRIENRNFPGSGASQIFNAISTTPPGLFPMLNEDGTIGGNSQYTNNPYGLITNTGYVRDNARYFQATIEADRRLDFISKDLTATIGFSYDNFYDQNLEQSKDFAVYQLNSDGTYTSFGNDEPLSSRRQRLSQNNRVALRGELDYSKEITDGGMLEMNAFYYQSKYYITSNNAPFAKQLGSLTSRYIIDDTYIGQLDLSYSGSENFAPGKRFGFFPTLSAAWIMSNEAFLKDNDWIDFMKLRASFGILGNDQLSFFNFTSAGTVSIGRFPYIGYYNNASGVFFGNEDFNSGITEGSPGNPDITWEKSRMFNIGSDFRMGIFDGSLDVFFENRSDILSLLSTVPEATGLSNVIVNFGEVNSHGVELNLGVTKRIDDLELSGRVLGTYNQSEIVKVNEPFRENEWESRVGHPVRQQFGLVALGFFQSEEEIENSPVQTYGPVQPGDIKYQDLNGDNIIDYRDEQAIGKTSAPTLYYGLQLGAALKGFDISLVFQGVSGTTSYLLNPLTRGFSNGTATPFILNRWTPENSGQADYPRLSSISNPNNYRASTFWQRENKYIRLKNAEIGYTIPEELTNKIGLTKTRVYLNGYNLLTFSDIDLVDPESFGAGVITYPLMKVFNFGFKLSIK